MSKWNCYKCGKAYTDGGVGLCKDGCSHAWPLEAAYVPAQSWLFAATPSVEHSELATDSATRAGDQANPTPNDPESELASLKAERDELVKMLSAASYVCFDDPVCADICIDGQAITAIVNKPRLRVVYEGGSVLEAYRALAAQLSVGGASTGAGEEENKSKV
jgi:hypothetical protein